MQSKLRLSKSIGKTFIHILQGDPMSDYTMAILNAADDPYNTQLMKRVNGLQKPFLIPGTPEMTPFLQNNIKFVIHLKMPRDFDTNNHEQFMQAFVDSFELASCKGLECITFTEPPLSLTQSRPKDFYAKIFLQAVQYYVQQQANTKIKLIKIINLDLLIVDIYMRELLQVVIISNTQSEVTEEKRDPVVVQKLEKEAVIEKQFQQVETHYSEQPIVTIIGQPTPNQQLSMQSQNPVSEVFQQQEKEVVQVVAEQPLQQVVAEQQSTTNEIQSNGIIPTNNIESIINFDANQFIAQYSKIKIWQICNETIDKMMRN